jgi:phasin
MSENIAYKNKSSEKTTEAVRELAQQGAAFGKDFGETSKAVAQDVHETLQHTYATVTKGAADFNVQWIEMVRANTNASFDFAQQLAGVKSPTEFLELSSAYARKQLETLAEQSRQLTGLTQKLTADAVQPLQAGVKNVRNNAA